ncbi:MAG: hypothetical protein PWQ23_549, partial [Thermoanaerobacter sp.]|nr:hypothetical protein [Thermoanaerobacter sp.]
GEEIEKETEEETDKEVEIDLESIKLPWEEEDGN